jgi:hypothetical protein
MFPQRRDQRVDPPGHLRVRLRRAGGEEGPGIVQALGLVEEGSSWRLQRVERRPVEHERRIGLQRPEAQRLVERLSPPPLPRRPSA